MTSRTFDKHCKVCNTYVHSVSGEDYEGIKKDVFCSQTCKDSNSTTNLAGMMEIANKREVWLDLLHEARRVSNEKLTNHQTTILAKEGDCY